MVNSRLFCRSKKKNLTIAKIFLAIFTITTLFLGSSKKVFAQDYDYSTFKTLFGVYAGVDPIATGIPEASPATQSGIFFKGTLKDDIDASKNIKKFYIGASLVLPGITQDSSPQDKETIGDAIWDKVSESIDESSRFLIHVYGTDSSGNAINILTDPYSSTYTTRNAVGSTGFGTVPVTTATSNSYGARIYKKNGDTNTYFTTQLAYIPIQQNNGQPIAGGSNLSADFWYCGGEFSSKNSDGNTVTIKGDFGSGSIPGNIASEKDKTFTFFGGNNCGDTAYWKIGPTINFTLPANATDSTVLTGTEQDIANQAHYEVAQSSSTLPSCGLVNGTVLGCIAQVIYGLVFKTISVLAALFGKLFDFFIGYSVSDGSYRLGFAVRGWQLVRDICNIFFIILLVWAGFAAVFGVGKNMKGVVAALIINAILINFSLFITRVIIDISNVTARVFYSRLYVCEGECTRDANGNVTNPSEGIGGYWPLSEKIVSAFNPQKIFSPGTVNPVLVSPTAVSDSQNSISSDVTGINSQAQTDAVETYKTGYSLSSNEYAAYFIIVTLIGSIIMFAIMKLFWGVAFMFLGRVIGLYLSMIFSPFAFLSRGNVPLVSKIKELSFSTWWGQLTSYAILAPLFIFYLYIVYAFLSTNFLSDFGLQASSNSFLENVIYISIPLLIVYVLIDQGRKLAQDYAGSMGNKIQGFVDKTVGGVGGVIGSSVGIAAGTGALLGTRVGSRLGKQIGSSRLGKWAASNAKNNKLARGINNTLSKTQTGSWDFRKSKIYSGINKATSTGGVKLEDKLTPTVANLIKPIAGNLFDFSEKRFEGGYKGQKERRQKQITENLENRIKYDHLSDEEAKLLWERHQNKKAEAVALHNFARTSDVDFDARAEEIKNWKKDLETEVKKLNDLRKELETQKDVISSEDKKKKEDAIKTQASVVQDYQKRIGENEQKQTEKINAIKGTDFKNDTVYKTKLEEAVKEQKSSDQKVYGKVDTVKDFNNAMRRDYAENLRNNSFWMKDGKIRWGRPGIGTGYGAAGSTLLAGVSSSLAGSFDAFATAIFSERIRFEQEALDAATQKYIKDYGKNRGKTTRSEQLKAKIKEVNDLIDEQLKKIHPEDKVKDMSDDEKRAELKKHIDNLETEYEIKKAQFEKAKEIFKANPSDKTKEDAFRKANQERKKAQDEYDKYKNAFDNKTKFEDQLEKEEEKGSKGEKKDDKKDEKRETKS
jgi:hypothetical protein